MLQGGNFQGRVIADSQKGHSGATEKGDIAFGKERILFHVELRPAAAFSGFLLGIWIQAMRRTREKGGISKIAMMHGITCFIDLRRTWKA